MRWRRCDSTLRMLEVLHALHNERGLITTSSPVHDGAVGDTRNELFPRHAMGGGRGWQGKTKWMKQYKVNLRANRPELFVAVGKLTPRRGSAATPGRMPSRPPDCVAGCVRASRRLRELTAVQL